MTSNVVARFVLRRRPYVAKAICCDWQRGHQWGPDYYNCVRTQAVSGGGSGLDKETASKWYKALLNIYKYWLKSILKFNVAYFLITGALVSFYLTRGFDSRTGFLLVLPMAVGIAVAHHAGDCATFIRLAEADVKEMRKKLDAEKVPDMGHVIDLLEWSRWLFVIVVVGLSVLVLVCLINQDPFEWFTKIFPFDALSHP